MTSDIVKHQAKQAAARFKELIKSDFHRQGMDYDEVSREITESHAKELERTIIKSENMKAVNRRIRAAKHRLTLDLFE